MFSWEPETDSFCFSFLLQAQWQMELLINFLMLLQVLVSLSSDPRCQTPLEMTRFPFFLGRQSQLFIVAEFPTPAPTHILLSFLQSFFFFFFLLSFLEVRLGPVKIFLYHSVGYPRVPFPPEGQVIGMDLWDAIVSPQQIAILFIFQKSEIPISKLHNFQVTASRGTMDAEKSSAMRLLCR